MQQAGCHGPAMVGGAQHFIEDGLQRYWQALATMLGRGTQGGPTCLPKSLVSVAETGGCGDVAASLFEFKAAADLVAGLIQRCHHLSDKLTRFGQHLLDQLGIHIRIGWQGLQVA